MDIAINVQKWTSLKLKLPPIKIIGSSYIIIGWIATIIAATYTFQGTFKYIKEQLYTSMLRLVPCCLVLYFVV